jgi:hypothetical protein
MPLALLAATASFATLLGVAMVVAVVALVAWALQLMQAANDRREFSLMLAGCMVCSAAVGLATVMVLTLTSPERMEARGLHLAPPATAQVSLDAVQLPFEEPLECLVNPKACPPHAAAARPPLVAAGEGLEAG